LSRTPSSVTVGLSPEIQTQVAQSGIAYKGTSPSVTSPSPVCDQSFCAFYRYILLVHYVGAFYWCILSMHSVGAFYRCIISVHSVGAFPNVGETINQSPQISVLHQSNAICDRFMYGNNGSMSINYSQIGSAITSGNNSNFILVDLFLLQMQQLDKEQQRRVEDNEHNMIQSPIERR